VSFDRDYARPGSFVARSSTIRTTSSTIGPPPQAPTTDQASPPRSPSCAHRQASVRPFTLSTTGSQRHPCVSAFSIRRVSPTGFPAPKPVDGAHCGATSVARDMPACAGASQRCVAQTGAHVEPESAAAKAPGNAVLAREGDHLVTGARPAEAILKRHPCLSVRCEQRLRPHAPRRREGSRRQACHVQLSPA